MKIALFATCIVDAMYPEVAQATVSVLERLGHTVTFPERQACCGQMHINSGKFKDAYPVVRNHVRAFEDESWDYAVAPSGSCVASLGHQHPMIAEYNGDPDLGARATQIADRTYELCQFLTDVCGVTDAAAELGSYFPHSVAYHPSCHGMRLLRLGDRQRDLLASVVGLDLRTIGNEDSCCGFGGTFSVKNPQVSGAMLGLGRALGETMALYMVIASAPGFRWSLFDGGTTFATAIANAAPEFNDDTKAGAYIAAGLVLFALTFIVNAAARTVVNNRK